MPTNTAQVVEVSASVAEFHLLFFTKPLTCFQQVPLQLALLSPCHVPLVSRCVMHISVITLMERDELAPVQDTAQQLVINTYMLTPVHLVVQINDKLQSLLISPDIKHTQL